MQNWNGRGNLLKIDNYCCLCFDLEQAGYNFDAKLMINQDAMNPNIDYEIFTQEIYQELLNANMGNIKTIHVQHNVKLKGKSGQEHQIDVFWEYELAGIKQKVAIECKNYKTPVPIGKVRDFSGVISDLNNVCGIIVTKEGYQKGAIEYAKHYGILLKELRIPKYG